MHNSPAESIIIPPLWVLVPSSFVILLVLVLIQIASSPVPSPLITIDVLRLSLEFCSIINLPSSALAE